jgi:hypothetical protein
MKSIFLFLINIVFVTTLSDLHAQITENEIDSCGYKHGYWREFKLPINVVTEEIGIRIPELNSEYYYLTKDKDRKYFPIIECVGEYRQGRKIGNWYEYNGNGSIKNNITYKDGVPHGDCKTFWGNGNLKEEFTISVSDSVSVSLFDSNGNYLQTKVVPKKNVIRAIYEN